MAARSLGGTSQPHAQPYNVPLTSLFVRRYDQLWAVKHAMLGLSVMSVGNPVGMFPGIPSAEFRALTVKPP